LAVLVHYFICPCGAPGKAETRKLHDCPCGISRFYRTASGEFSESLYRTYGYPSNVYRFERIGDVFVFEPEEVYEDEDYQGPRRIPVASLLRPPYWVDLLKRLWPQQSWRL